MKKHQVEDLFVILFIIGCIYGVYSLFSTDEESTNAQVTNTTTITQSKTDETNQTTEENIQIDTNITQAQKEENQSIINAIIEKHSNKNETNISQDLVITPIEEKNVIEVNQVEEVATQEENQSNELIYIVQPGDVLGRIGNKFEIDYTRIKEYNNLSSDIVTVGQVLKIPSSNDILIKEKPSDTKEQNTTTNSSSNVSFKQLYKQIQNDILEKIIPKTQENPTFSTRSSYVNIRLTILKDGSYEQLVLQNGDKEYYDFIKDDIRSIFPIEISSEIESKFPRYFRMKIEY